MLTSPHPLERELLLALDGELSDRRQSIVDQHVATCGTCRSRLDQIQLGLSTANVAYLSAFDLSEPNFPSSRPRLERALQEAAAEWNQSWLLRLRLGLSGPVARIGLGLAAALVLFAVIWSPSRAGEDVTALVPASGSSLPIALLTPGSVSSLTASELCEGARPSRLVTAASRDRVLRDYRMEHAPANSYELDALITPELGGTTERENLWPQHYASPVWNARVKDRLEELLPRLVCSNQVALAHAQQEIATDWIAAYKRYFKTDRPLRSHLNTRIADDDDLVFAPTHVVAENAAPRIPGISFVRR